MTRVRTDNVFGTLTDNPLLIGGTTMNSAGLANLAAVSSAEAIIVLDPNRVAGAPEIVVVTAHTGAATSATIVRGQFGTTARQHLLGTEWVHGPIASNATSYATAADDQGDYVPMNAWEAYVPTLFQNVSVTKTVTSARFVRIGRLIHFAVDLSVTSAGTAGNAVAIGLPVNAAVTAVLAGQGQIYDSSAAVLYNGNVGINTAADITIWPSADGAATVLGVRAFTAALASGDLIRVSGTYEAVS